MRRLTDLEVGDHGEAERGEDAETEGGEVHPEAAVTDGRLLEQQELLHEQVAQNHVHAHCNHTTSRSHAIILTQHYLFRKKRIFETILITCLN